MATLTGVFTLGRNAESRVTSNGTTVVQLSAAYNYGRKGDDGKRPTQWLRLSMFGRQAEQLCDHLTKGKQVSLIVKDLHVATFQKQDGSEGVSLEGIADFDDFVRGSPQQQSQGGYGDSDQPRQAPRQAPQRQQAPAASSGFDDMDSDCPF